MSFNQKYFKNLDLTFLILRKVSLLFSSRLSKRIENSSPVWATDLKARMNNLVRHCLQIKCKKAEDVIMEEHLPRIC